MALVPCFTSWPEAGVDSHSDFRSITTPYLQTRYGRRQGLGTENGCSFLGEGHLQIGIAHSPTGPHFILI